jgi:hypothetical protein
MNVKYTINAVKEDGSNFVDKLYISMTLNQKYREPEDTPCYRKMETGFVKLEYPEEIMKCYGTIECYKKVSKDNYVKIAEPLEITECSRETMDCYEKVEDTYYKLIENPEGIRQCYDSEGNAFERATYDNVDKLKIDSREVINYSINKLSHVSTIEKVPSNENYSLIYEFKVTNKGNSTMYIKALTFDDINNGQIKEKSFSKVKLSTNDVRILLDNKFYYVLEKDEYMTITIEIKNLLTSDASKKGQKEFNINLPIVVK